MRLVMLGAPGSGKGTQARLITTKYGLIHVSMGQMLRKEVANRTEIGQSIHGTLNKGEMVADEIVNRLIDKKLRQYHSIILDGYPRTVAQAQHLEAALEVLGARLDAVFLLELPVEVVVRRLSGRRVCEKCNKTYHVLFYPLKRCTCGGRLIQREDDNPKTIRRRMEVYQQGIKPLQKFYEERGILYAIDAEQSVEAIFADISRILDEEILPHLVSSRKKQDDSKEEPSVQ